MNLIIYTRRYTINLNFLIYIESLVLKVYYRDLTLL